MSTIKDVAAEANVSIATVSRVLNKTQYVSSETSDKVLSAVKKVGYRPNAIAKSLKTNKTYMVGLVVPDIANPYFVEIARGVEKIISLMVIHWLYAALKKMKKRKSNYFPH